MPRAVQLPGAVAAAARRAAALGRARRPRDLPRRADGRRVHGGRVARARARARSCSSAQRAPTCATRASSLAPVADADAARACARGAAAAPPATVRERVAFKLSILPDGNGAPASRSGGFFSGGFAVLKHESGFVEFFYPLMRPWVHYVPLLANLSHLGEKIACKQAHDAAAARVANASSAFAERQLTDAAVACSPRAPRATRAYSASTSQRPSRRRAPEPTGENRWFAQLRREEEKRRASGRLRTSSRPPCGERSARSASRPRRPRAGVVDYRPRRSIRAARTPARRPPSRRARRRAGTRRSRRNESSWAPTCRTAGRGSYGSHAE